MSQLPTQPSPQAMIDAAAQQAAEVQQQLAAQTQQPASVLSLLQPSLAQAVQPAYAQPQPVPVQQQPPQPAKQAVQQPIAQQIQPAPAQQLASAVPQQPGVINAMVIANDAPQWLVEASADAPSGIDVVKTMILPPQLRIRQMQSNNPMVLEHFQPGDIYLAPELQRLWRQGELPVKFVPIFCYQEWTLNNPNGVKPFVVERTNDPQSHLAKAAANADKRRIPIPGSQDPRNPGQPLYRNAVEHLIFLVVLQIENGPMVPVMLDFNKTGLMYGKRFSNLIVGRGGKPLYACVFELSTASTTNTDGTFFNFSVNNPGPGEQWVKTVEEFNIFKQLHLDLRTKQESGEIVSLDDDDVAPNGGSQPVQYPPQQQQPYYQQPPQQWQQPPQGYAPQQGVYPQQQQPPQPHYGYAPPMGQDPNTVLQQAGRPPQQGYGGGF